MKILRDKKYLATLLLLVASALTPSLARADQESIAITTYYPTPQGVYNRIRLARADCSDSSACPRPGEICFDAYYGRLLTCSGSPSLWRMGGLWATSGTDRIYLANTSGRVGIGTNSPTAGLDVRGYTDVCTQQLYHKFSGKTHCPYGTAIVAQSIDQPLNFDYFSIGFWVYNYTNYVDTYFCCRTCYANGTHSTNEFVSTTFYTDADVYTDTNGNGICDDYI